MIGRVVVVGLGPGAADLVTTGTLASIEGHEHRFLRTTRHPSAHVVDGARSFDDLYEASSTMDEVYRGIVDALVGAASDHGDVLYAVPGSPLVAERTVELLLADERIEVEVVPALSFLDLAWVRLGIDPIAAGVRVVDGHRFAVEAAGSRGPLLVAQCDRPSVLSDVKLAVDEPPVEPVLVLSGLGTDHEAITPVAWDDLDRAVEPDHLTSLWIPRLAAPVAGAVQEFADLVVRLRDECPWDREQTHRSLTRYLVEETYEVVDVLDRLPAHAGAIDRPDSGPRADPDDESLDDLYLELEEELGDLLFQIVFHARLAAEAGRFDLSDVAQGIHDKLVARHPHVFGDVDVDGDARQVESNWEAIKAEESGRQSAFDGIPASLPSLARAAKLVDRARRLGVDVEPVLPPGAAHDVGDAILRMALDLEGADPDEAVRRAVARLEERLRDRELRVRSSTPPGAGAP